MKLWEFKKKIDYILANNPRSKHWNVIYSSDEEGNFFDKTLYAPTIGSFDEETNEFDNSPNKVPNAVCIN